MDLKHYSLEDLLRFRANTSRHLHLINLRIAEKELVEQELNNYYSDHCVFCGNPDEFFLVGFSESCWHVCCLKCHENVSALSSESTKCPCQNFVKSEQHAE
jgi:hypothetical protein